MAQAVYQINSSLEGPDPLVTLEALKNPTLCLRSLSDDCAYDYHLKLGKERITKEGVAGWAEHRSKEGYTYYYNEETGDHAWTKPEEYGGQPTILTKEEIQVGVVGVHGFIKFFFLIYVFFYRVQLPR